MRNSVQRKTNEPTDSECIVHAVVIVVVVADMVSGTRTEHLTTIAMNQTIPKCLWDN